MPGALTKRLLSLLAVVRVAALAEVPELEVNLDLEPEERWRAVIMYYLNSGMLHSMTMANADLDTLPVQSVEAAKAWQAAVMADMPEEYIREATGMVKLVNTVDPSLNATVEDVILRNYDYEMNYPDYCSGLLATMANGTVVHGRNLDYYNPKFNHQGKMIGLSELATNVIFTRQGRRLMTSITWPGQLGIHTAMRFDGWTFEQNTRRTGYDMEANLAAAKEGGVGFGWYARRVMEETDDFDIAVQKLSSAKFMASHYFVMAGKGAFQGVVLSIDRLATHLENTPEPMFLGQETWHIIQTNDDHGAPPLDYRRPAEMRKLSVLEQEQISPAWALEEMRDMPLFNSDTVFSWVAVPQTNYYKVVLSTADRREGLDEPPGADQLTRLASSSSEVAKQQPKSSFLRRTA